ncbi:MAG TPA: hypothetical protein PKA13_10975 [Geminicoccaceae bacterium]|nr:hypothetical protein [Geminicoccaceae bacterium]
MRVGLPAADEGETHAAAAVVRRLARHDRRSRGPFAARRCDDEEGSGGSRAGPCAGDAEIRRRRDPSRRGAGERAADAAAVQQRDAAQSDVLDQAQGRDAGLCDVIDLHAGRHIHFGADLDGILGGDLAPSGRPPRTCAAEAADETHEEEEGRSRRQFGYQRHGIGPQANGQARTADLDIGLDGVDHAASRGIDRREAKDSHDCSRGHDHDRHCQQPRPEAGRDDGHGHESRCPGRERGADGDHAPRILAGAYADGDPPHEPRRRKGPAGPAIGTRGQALTAAMRRSRLPARLVG